MRLEYNAWLEKKRLESWPNRDISFMETHYRSRFQRFVERELARNNALIDSPRDVKEYLERVFSEVDVPLSMAKDVYESLRPYYKQLA